MTLSREAVAVMLATLERLKEFSGLSESEQALACILKGVRPKFPRFPRDVVRVYAVLDGSPETPGILGFEIGASRRSEPESRNTLPDGTTDPATMTTPDLQTAIKDARLEAIEGTPTMQTSIRAWLKSAEAELETRMVKQ